MREIWGFLTNVYRRLFVNKAGAWTALFTCLLTIGTFQMVKIYTIINDTTRSSERAFISFAGLNIGPRIQDPGNIWLGNGIFVNWNNSGTTPGKNVVLQLNVKPWPLGEDLPASYEFPLTPDKSRGVIGPKGGYSTQRIISGSVLSDNWHAKTRLFLWGAMLYKDIFPNDPDRLTEFCVEISQITVNKTAAAQSVPAQPPKAVIPSAGVPDVAAKPIDIGDFDAAIVGMTWAACSDHNCYDEDCKDYKERVKDMR